MNFSITRRGNPLDPSLYTWDEKTKTLSTDESDLILDFSDMGACTFKTGDDCTFITRDHCTFDTNNYCTFKTGRNCTFDTGWNCTFDTEVDCTFKTGSDCTFNTREACTFKTKEDCTFDIWDNYKEIKHGKGCVAIIRTDREMKVINFDEPSSIRFLKEA